MKRQRQQLVNSTTPTQVLTDEAKTTITGAHRGSIKTQKCQSGLITDSLVVDDCVAVAVDDVVAAHNTHKSALRSVQAFRALCSTPCKHPAGLHRQ